MLAGTDDYVEISRRTAVGSRITLARDSDSLTIASAGLDAYFQRLSSLYYAFASAHRAHRNVLSRSMAARTLNVEFHPSTGLCDLSRAFAFRTYARGFQKTATLAIAARIATGNVQAQHGAANCLPEADRDLIFQISARLRAAGLRAAATEHAGKDVSESSTATLALASRATALEHIGEVKAPEVEWHPLRLSSTLTAGETAKAACSEPAATPRSASSPGISLGCGRINIVGVVAELIVDLALLGIAEDVIGLGNGLELLFRSFVAGVDVRMVLTCQLAECLADLVRRGGLFDAERAVI